MNKYLRAISSNLIFFTINSVFFLVITPVLIRVMGEEFYGLWMILMALMLFSNIGTLGINTIVMKFSSEAINDKKKNIFYNQVVTTGYILVLAMATLMAIMLLVSKNIIVERLDTTVVYKMQFKRAIDWIILGLFPQFALRVPQGFLLGQLENNTVRGLELFSSILLFGGAALIAWGEKNIVLIAAWNLAVSLFILGLYIVNIRRYITPLRWEPHWQILKRMFSFSKWMFFQSLAIALFQQFDRILVGIVLGPAIAGVYSVGTSIALRLSMVVGQITRVMVPYASLKETLGDNEKLYLIFRQLSRYISLLIAGFGSFLIIWMPDILSLWISPEYAKKYATVFQILILAYSILSLSRPAHQTLTGMGKVKFTAIVYFLSTTLMLTGVFFLSRMYGLIGAAASNLVLASLLAFNLFVYHELQSSIPWQNVFTDLQWGVFLPILIYGLSLFSSSLIMKIMVSIALGILIILLIMKDAFVKNRLLQFMQSAFKSRI